MPKAARNPRTPNRRVVALAYDDLCTFEFGIVAEVFGLERPEMGEDWYRFTVAGIDPEPRRAGGGVKVTVDGGLDDIKAWLVEQANNQKSNRPEPTGGNSSQLEAVVMSGRSAC